MLTQVLPLLFQDVRHLLVNLLEELVDLWQKLIGSALEGIANLIESVLSKRLGSLLIKNTASSQILFKTLNRAREPSKELLPLLHLLLISVSL